MKLIVGLGNPGLAYSNTRHNVGFMIIDYYVNKYGVKVNKQKFHGLYQDLIINNEKVIFLKPQSFMNLSGEVVKKFVDFFKISVDDILVINDDLDLSLGKQHFGNYKLKSSGSSGGHNGLKNIEFYLNTKNYKRLKVGISNDKKIDTKDYVLGHFSESDLKVLTTVIEKTSDILDDFFKYSFDKVMNIYNTKGEVQYEYF